MTENQNAVNAESIKDAFAKLSESASPTTWAALAVGGVAQYGASIYVRALAKNLVVAHKLHHRIAIAVATHIVVWACRDWIKTAAYKVCAEIAEAVETLVDLFRDAKKS